MKDTILKMLTPTLFLCMALLMTGYQLITVIKQFWMTDEKYDFNFAHVTVPQVKTTDNNTEEAFQFNLFGMASSSTESTEQTAQSSLRNEPQPMLNINISGIVSSSKAENSIAIIVKDHKQISVGFGEKIPGYDATITDILKDCIVVNYQGKHETLFINFDKHTNNNTDNSSSSGNFSTSAIYQPKSFFDFVNISPVMESNKLNGYRLNPGKDRKLFYHVGLQDDDLAVSLNGSDLRDAKQAQQIMEQLPEITEMKITVERDGQLHDVFIAVGAGSK